MASAWSGDDHARFNQLVRAVALGGPELLRDLFPEAFASDEHAAAWDEKYGDKAPSDPVVPAEPAAPSYPVGQRLGESVASQNPA